jgi:hypothetical protein
MDKLQLRCQSSSGIGISSGICDGMVGLSVAMVVDGSSSSGSGSSDINIHTQYYLNFTTLRCRMRYKKFF